MVSDIEHMLTNIVLWFSSKPCGNFILHSPVPQETRAIRISSFDYNGAREKLVSYLNSLGIIYHIQYDHKGDCYQIFIQQEDVDGQKVLQIYTICYVSKSIIEI